MTNLLRVASVLGVNIRKSASELGVNSLGHYNLSEHEIVVREISDIETVCHELWHSLDELNVLSYEVICSDGAVLLLLEGHTFDVDVRVVRGIQKIYPDFVHTKEIFAFTMQEHPGFLVDLVMANQTKYSQASAVRRAEITSRAERAKKLEEMRVKAKARNTRYNEKIEKAKAKKAKLAAKKAAKKARAKAKAK